MPCPERLLALCPTRGSVERSDRRHGGAGPVGLNRGARSLGGIDDLERRPRLAQHGSVVAGQHHSDRQRQPVGAAVSEHLLGPARAVPQPSLRGAQRCLDDD